MCPWTDERKRVENRGLMHPRVWRALRPYLQDIQSIDFTGGGEPLLQPKLVQWVEEARANGCETGLLTNGVLLGRQTSAALIAAGLNWICFSVDGAEKQTYESIRIGADFDAVCENIAYFCRAGLDRGIKTMINMVIMAVNRHQLEDIMRLASSLGVSQVNFKQCDVIRGDRGKGMGLFATRHSKEIRGLEKALTRARKLGKKLGLTTTAFAFSPEELPVCAQDPRDSLFIRYNGQIAPCINLAIGGPTTFLGDEATVPSIIFGCLPEWNLAKVRNSKLFLGYRDCFNARVRAHEDGFLSVDLSEPSLSKLKAANRAAIDAMPPAPEGCRVCHYLFGI
jgi:MoaA/NifB/PqqE/SkfB family radical SAM enzyme